MRIGLAIRVFFEDFVRRIVARAPCRAALDRPSTDTGGRPSIRLAADARWSRRSWTRHPGAATRSRCWLHCSVKRG